MPIASSPFFVDRDDAGLQLARRLEAYRHCEPLVLAIPRGGVPIALAVARHLHAPLGVALTRKVVPPGQSGLSVGAVAYGGALALDADALAALGLTEATVGPAVAEQRQLLAYSLQRYRASDGLRCVRRRVVLLVDDSLDSGVSALAAIRSLRQARPAAIVVAVPVAARRGIRTVAPEADEVVTIALPWPYEGEGLWYRDFARVSKDEAMALVEGTRQRLLE